MKVFLAAVTLGLLPAAATGQDRPVVGLGPDSVVLAPGARYQGSRLHRFLWGSTYRDLWATPIKVPVLDLRRFAGGLRPLKRGGGNQTKSLRFVAADGSDFVFRLVDKDRVTIPVGFENTIVERITRNQVSAQHPAAAEISAPLLRAAGVLHVTPILAAMPNDSLLGEFREEFAGKLGMIEPYPSTPEGVPGFAGAAVIIDSDTLLKQLDRDPAQQIDTRAFLRARLMDMFLNDWDRHPGQWKWARFDSGASRSWVPLPRDRDKPFISHGGIIKILGRVSPNVMTFGTTYPPIQGLTWNALEFDRRLLAGLEKPVWDSVVLDLKRRLTDAVIDSAVLAMPVEYRDRAPELARILKVRRDRLADIADRFYGYLAPVQDLHATDAADRADLTHRDDGSVEVALRSGAREPYFHRRFNPEETVQIRLYLHGGDDSTFVTGKTDRSIPVWIIGGNGSNVLVDSGAPATRLFDAGTASSVEYGPDSSWNRRPWIKRAGRMVAPPRDRGDKIVPGFGVSSEGDIGLLFRVALNKYDYGFRRVPYSARYGVSAEYATLYQGWRVAAIVDRRKEASPLHITGRARMSEIEVINFHGLGNDTPDDPSHFYEVRQRQWQLHPSVGVALGARSDVSAGPVVQYTRTDNVPGRFISANRPYGFGDFGQAGLRMTVTHDGRDRSIDPRSGIRFDASGSWYPAVWDVREGFGVLAAAASTYFTLPVPAGPKLVLRAGARKVFGEFPFQEAAFIGGRSAVRTSSPSVTPATRR